MITIDILCNGNFLRNNINPKKKSLNYQGVTLINNHDGRAAFTSINTGNNDLVYHWFSAMQYYIQNLSDEPLVYGENFQLFMDYYEDIFGFWYLSEDLSITNIPPPPTFPYIGFILSINNPMSWDDLNDYCRRVTERKS